MSAGRTLRTTEGHRASYPDPVIATSGEPLQLGPEDEEYPGWIRATDPRGRTGWVPAEWVEVEGKTGTLRRDYSARELTIGTGEPVEVLEEVSGWSLVRGRDGETGWVPSSILGGGDASP